jgi:nitrate/TMAO reductase-like tetraheme cytochrome c subunit
MRWGKIKRLALGLSILMLIFSGCSNTEQVKEIESKDKADSLFIQKVENDTSYEELTKVVNDKQQIEQVLAMIEGLEVKKISSEETMEKMKASNTYMFGFSEGKEFESGKKLPFAFYALENGTFIFPYSDFNSPQEPLITVEGQEELLDDIKQLFELTF